MTDDFQDDGRPVTVRRFTPAEGADGFARYLLMQRERLIIEIRMIEELLGMPLSIPRRQR